MVQYEAVLIELEPGSSKTFVPKAHSVNGALVELEPGSSKTFTPKTRSVNGALVELEPGSSSELVPMFHSRTGALLDAFGGDLTHYKPDYIRSREGEAFDIHADPLTHYKPDYIRSREGNEFLVLWNIWTDGKNLFNKLIVKNADAADLYAKFEIRYGIENIPAGFEVGQDSINLFNKLIVKNADAADLYAKFEAQTTKNIYAKFEAQVTKNLFAKFRRLPVFPDSESIFARFIARHSDTEDLYAKFEAQTTENLFAEFEIQGSAALFSYLIVKNVNDENLYAKFEAQGIADIFAKFELRQGVEDLFNKLIVRNADTKNLFARFMRMPVFPDSKGLFAKFEFQYSVALFAFFAVNQPSSTDLYAEFDLRQSFGGLYAEFELRQNTENLYAKLRVIQSEALFSKFTVKHTDVADLFAEVIVYKTFGNLFSRLIVRNVSTIELYGKATVMHSADEEIIADFTVSHTSTEELFNKFIVRKIASEALFAKFQVGGNEDLKATFYAATRRDKDAYLPIIVDGIVYWINHLELLGRGFIGWPIFEGDTVDKRSAIDSLKITTEEVSKGYKEVTFGWLYEPVYLSPIKPAPCVPIRKEFARLVTEDWDWDGLSYLYDDSYLDDDTTCKVVYHTDFCNSGWQWATTNYSHQTEIQCSIYDGHYPGEIPNQRHINVETLLMRWSLPDLADLPDLDRLAWVRMELYRCSGLTGGYIRPRRIPDCSDIEENYTFWNPANKIGGCYTNNGTSTGLDPSKVWQPATISWYAMGRYQLNMCRYGQHYMGNPTFRVESASDPKSLSWDNNVYESIYLTDLYKGWLDGTYRNHGVSLEMAGQSRSWSDFRMNINSGSGDGPSFHSKKNATNRPRIRMRFWPEGKSDTWEFMDAHVWDINEDDPYSGVGSLTLKNNSKMDIWGSSGISYMKFLTTKPLKEGYVETVIRFNSATRKKLKTEQYSPYTPTVYTVEEDTPRDNEFQIQFRHQDSNNFYYVQFNPGAVNTRIRREYGGSVTTLNDFDGNFKVGNWYQVRVFWAIDEDGILKICCYKYDDEQEVWRFIGGASDSNNYWSGGEVRLASYDCDLDDTEIWEVT